MAPGNRSARLWLGASLTALAGASLVQIVRLDGSWLPLVESDWTAIDYFAVVVWLAAIVLLFRLELPELRQRPGGKQPRMFGTGKWGSVILLGGIAAFLFGLISTVYGPRWESVSLCEGQSQRIESGDSGPWIFSLRQLMPVAERDFTGLEAKLDIRFSDGVVIGLRPQLRTFLFGPSYSVEGERRAVRWNGELWLSGPVGNISSSCVDALRLNWYPHVQWLRYGAWLAVFGAVLMLLASIRSAWWRADALERIANRREEQSVRPVKGR